MSWTPFTSKDASILARSLGISRQDASLSSSDVSLTGKRKQPAASSSKQQRGKRPKKSAVLVEESNQENEQLTENPEDEADAANEEGDKYAENATMKLLLNPFQLHHALGYESDVSLSSADDADRLMPPPSRLPTHRSKNSDSIVLQNSRNQQMVAAMADPTVDSLSSAAAALPLEPTQEMIQQANQQIMQHLKSEKQRLLNNEIARKHGTGPPSISPSLLASSAMEHFHRMQREHTSLSRAERSQQNKRTLAAMMQQNSAGKIFAPSPAPSDEEEEEEQQTPVRTLENSRRVTRRQEQDEDDREDSDEEVEEEEEEAATETPPRAQRSPKKKSTGSSPSRVVNKSSASSSGRKTSRSLADSFSESNDEEDNDASDE